MIIDFCRYKITGQDLVGVLDVSTAPLSIFNLVTLIITWLLYFAGVLAFIFSRLRHYVHNRRWKSRSNQKKPSKG